MPAARQTILVVDDDSKLRAMERTVLERAGFQVEEAADAAGACVAAEEAPPDLVLLDVRLPGTSGYEVYRELRDRDASLPIIFVSGDRAETYDRVVGLMLGADDYIVKPFDPEELVARIRRSLQRRSTTATIARPAAVAELLGELTPREREVLDLLARGRSSKQIANELVISSRTVGTHVQRVLSKLGVHSRAQAVALAHQTGFVDADDVELRHAS